MSCVCFYSDYISDCVESIVVNGGFAEGVEYEYRVTDKFGHMYSGLVVGDENGAVQIDVLDFPDGFFNQHAGYFELRFRTGAPLVDFFVQGDDLEGNVTEYEYIVFHAKGGNQNKNTLL